MDFNSYRGTMINPVDHGALLSMTAWFLSCALILCTATRIAIRCSTQRKLSIDDILIIMAACIAIGSTIAISFAVKDGLGRRSYLLSASDITHIQKAMYASSILYILTVGTSKLSVSLFLNRLTSTALQKASVTTVGILIMCWGIAATFAVAFACGILRPWSIFMENCIEMEPFWTSISIVDISTDIAMILIPLKIVWSLQLDQHKKTTIMFFFALRLIPITTSIIRLVLFTRMLSHDPSYDGIPYSIATQCHSALSVIIACTPALKPFVESARSGMLSTSLAKRNPDTTFGQNSSDMTSPSEHSKPSNASSKHQHRGKYISSEQLSSTKSVAPPSALRSTPTYSQWGAFFQNAFGLSAKPSIVDIGSTHTSTKNPTKSMTYRYTSSSGLNPPPRPPPPPDHLRPDIMNFSFRVDYENQKTQLMTGQEGAAVMRYGEDNQSLKGRNSMKKQTQAWGVHYDDYHNRWEYPRDPPKIPAGHGKEKGAGS